MRREVEAFPNFVSAIALLRREGDILEVWYRETRALGTDQSFLPLLI